MKLKIKTIMSDYNEETGTSFVTIATDIGQFTGFAQLHEEDKEIASRYAGCRYAEMRAGILYMKEKLRIVKYQLKPLYNIYWDLKQRKYNENNIGFKLLEKQIYNLEDDQATLTRNIETLTTRLNEAINDRPEMVKKMEERKYQKQDNE